ncbi:uncharacterized protein MONOS_5041 [Monocercomonoides exilis]|uniref:uncharacterized protein n=1 Tax=Monocercomonoides exilis TaxID=2049356 RepID=UPI00355A923F|nr:hypothetical protein MONOS_5041 [Monocercomonoides exilis]|eukprot:MONOS_5041.1-p1 / transcript=MONOS_5041.1 / gene=MONOS_5041 / organism=Monocercomonoides_exilis_PA203 / gene_product=unspecified product / transcript_product=unspecified product / location=Mono_scaffold00142:75346-78558(+) / protein_length=904 / sequence_SO=supercontig / SO=protein_coding / is_pseudo=false
MNFLFSFLVSAIVFAEECESESEDGNAPLCNALCCGFGGCPGYGCGFGMPYGMFAPYGGYGFGPGMGYGGYGGMGGFGDYGMGGGYGAGGMGGYGGYGGGGYNGYGGGGYGGSQAGGTSFSQTTSLSTGGASNFGQGGYGGYGGGGYGGAGGYNGGGYGGYGGMGAMNGIGRYGGLGKLFLPMSCFGEIHFKNLGRSTVALRECKKGDTICIEEPLVRSFPPERYYVDICDNYEIDRMFGVFLIGYAFAEQKYRDWIYNVMYGPEESTLDIYPNFRETLSSFAKPLNEYLAMRYKKHPAHWNKYIVREPMIYEGKHLIHLWLIWNTNSHSFDVYFPETEEEAKKREIEEGKSHDTENENEDSDVPYEELQEDEASDLGTAIFEVASRVPHSCSPNMSYTVCNKPFNGLRYRCVRPAKIGEILSFSYIEPDDLLFRPTLQRRGDLIQHKYFFCLCPRCRADDMMRLLPCPAWHMCHSSSHSHSGAQAFAVRSDVEGWHFIHRHPEMFDSNGDEDRVGLPKPSLSLFRSEHKEDAGEILMPTPSPNIPTPVAFPIASPTLKGKASSRLFWGDEIDAPFDFHAASGAAIDKAEWVLKPWRCLECNERFSEEEMRPVVEKESALRKVVLKLLHKPDTRIAKILDEAYGPVDDEEALGEEDEQRRRRGKLTKKERELRKDFQAVVDEVEGLPKVTETIEKMAEIRKKMRQMMRKKEMEEAGEEMEKDSGEEKEALTEAEEEEDRDEAEAVVRYHQMLTLLSICQKELSPMHWTSAWLNEHLMEFVSEHANNQILIPDPTLSLLVHGQAVIDYTNSITRNGLDYCSGPAYYRLRLATLLDQLTDEQALQTKAPKDARTASSQLYEDVLVSFVSEWGLEEPTSEHILHMVKGGKERGMQLLKDADVCLDS